MTHSTESAIATRDAQAALDARREQQLQATTAAVARVALVLNAKLYDLITSLGYSDVEALRLCGGITNEHKAIAAGMLADAFHPDMIHEIMRRFGGFGLSDEDDESFRVIKDELKGIGKP